MRTRSVTTLAATLAALVLSAVLIPLSAQASTDPWLLQTTNSERASVGLAPLNETGDLDSVAQAWSNRMAATGTLAHNPDLRAQVGNWKTVGENVGVGGSVASVHAALMASPGHRANILDAGYREIGLGVTYSGGRVWITQVFRTPRVATTPAPPAQPVAPPAAPVGAAQAGTATGRDYNGDKRVDAFGRTHDGTLWFYPGAASGAAQSRILSGSGWDMHDTLLPIPDVTGDGKADLWARHRATGTLWLYPGNGGGGFGAPRQIGSGWQMHDSLLTPGDVTGDGKPDLWAREASTGNLWLYTGDGTGGLQSPRYLGAGWQMHDALLTAGDATGDGKADLWGRERATGNLWLYPGDGKGGIAGRALAGGGWQMHDVLLGVQDVTGDKVPDLMARERATGTRWLYTGNGTGGFSSRRQLDHGWNTVNALF